MKKLGKIIEVFIPKQTKNNKLLDVMDSNQIGFKIQIDNDILELIQKQNENNSQIMKNDVVVVTEKIISGQKYIDIELYGGEDYE